MESAAGLEKSTGNCIWRGKGFVPTFHVPFNATVWVWDFMCADVYPPCRAGLDLRGRAWRLAKDWGPRLARLWLQRMSSVYREMWRGGRDSCFHSVLQTTHIHTRTYTGGWSCTGSPTSPAVCMCLCYSWPLGPVAKTDRLTHIRSPKYSWAWCRLNGCETCWCRLTRSAKKNNTKRGEKVKWVKFSVPEKWLLFYLLRWNQEWPNSVLEGHNPPRISVLPVRQWFHLASHFSKKKCVLPGRTENPAGLRSSRTCFGHTWF